ncbi:hypothetical protein [Salininema proteolyticum]|uniref:Uncharacterized protein n=1 Tax=Salininema proteolyticum TaxID=1607685 RepID=A0ABV8TSJ8_9ACTN
MSYTDYTDAVHELRQWEQSQDEELRRLQDDLGAQKSSLRELRRAIDRERDQLADACSKLRTEVPRGTDIEAVEGDTKTLLRDGKVAVREAGDERMAALRQGELPSFLPKAPHVIREGVVYGLAMLGSFLFQNVALAQTGGRDYDGVLWIIMLPPVAAAMVGWAVMSNVNRPRLAGYHRGGRRTKGAEKRNPRLGVAMALITIGSMFYIVYGG